MALTKLVRAVIALFALVGCASASAPVTPAAAPSSLAPSPSCADDDAPEITPRADDARVDLVCVSGVTGDDARIVRAKIASRPGAPLDAERVASDLRAIFAAGLAEDARAVVRDRANGRVLTFEIVPRPRVTAVEVDAPSILRAAFADRLGQPLGRPFDELHTREAARAIVDDLKSEGFFDAQADVTFDGSVVHARVALGPRVRIDGIVLEGNRQVSAKDLTQKFLLKKGEPFRTDVAERDALVLAAEYYDRGRLEIEVKPPRYTFSADRSKVTVTFELEERALFRVGKLTMTGLLQPGEPATYLARLALRTGQVFRRSAIVGWLDEVREDLKKKGREVEITPETELDPKRHTVDLGFRVTAPESRTPAP